MVQIDYDFYRAMKSGKISERIFHRERVKIVLRSFDYKNKKVLDLGCGTGPTLIPLAKRGVDITGVDISEYCIKKLKEYCKQEGISPKLLVSKDDKKIPFRNEEFDIILLIDVLEHVENPKYIVSEVMRVLKKKGMVLVISPWKYNPVVQSKFLRRIFSARPNMDEAWDKPFTPTTLKELFSGFKVLKISLAVFFIEICAIFEKI